MDGSSKKGNARINDEKNAKKIKKVRRRNE